MNVKIRLDKTVLEITLPSSQLFISERYVGGTAYQIMIEELDMAILELIEKKIDDSKDKTK